ncbi:MAG: cbb3-type cytochrome oxidase assembly protein CcoS [Bacteroidetes bacterium]|nr:cbb3-type cytochrome oxidase assembly protein CcoS [Bacteroidota bacterium]
MSALYIMIAASLLVAGFFLLAFVWSVNSDQFDDKEGAAMRMLYDNNIDKTIQE